MSTSAIVAIIVIVVVVLGAIAAFAIAGRLQRVRTVGLLSRETRQRDKAARRRERQAARDAERGLVPVGGGGLATTGAEIEPWTPPDEKEIGINRRQFLNRSIVTLFAVGSGGLTAALLAFLWPQESGGFGGKITIGSTSDINQNIQKGDGFYYVPQGKLYVTSYPSYALAKAKAVYPPTILAAMEAGFAVLYQKCPHLGCRVPPCNTSQWFECPCHGSQYNQVGEKKGGPAPRGMDRFPATVTGGTLTVDTNPSTVVLGPPIGTDTTGQEAEGPHCV